MKQLFMRSLVFMLLSGLALAQDAMSDVQVSLEAFIVSTVTKADGTTEEQFTAAEAARPGQIVEYRVLVVNTSSETLPGGTVVVTGPVPASTVYLEDSASAGDSFRTEFSADEGLTFSEPPVVIVVTDENGNEEEVIADPASYSAVRWTVLDILEPSQELTFVYRVVVR